MCDGCDVAVHKRCYGILRVPSGSWFCDPCAKNLDPGQLQCALCHHSGYALKSIVGKPKQFVHLHCARFFPEIKYGKAEVVDLKTLNQKRLKLKCQLCSEPGACVQCCHGRCGTSVHPNCALHSESSRYVQHLTAVSGGVGMGMQHWVYCPIHARHRPGSGSVQTKGESPRARGNGRGGAGGRGRGGAGKPGRGDDADVNVESPRKQSGRKRPRSLRDPGSDDDFLRDGENESDTELNEEEEEATAAQREKLRLAVAAATEQELQELEEANRSHGEHLLANSPNKELRLLASVTSVRENNIARLTSPPPSRMTSPNRVEGGISGGVGVGGDGVGGAGAGTAAAATESAEAAADDVAMRVASVSPAEAMEVEMDVEVNGKDQDQSATPAAETTVSRAVTMAVVAPPAGEDTVKYGHAERAVTAPAVAADAHADASGVLLLSVADIQRQRGLTAARTPTPAPNSADSALLVPTAASTVQAAPAPAISAVPAPGVINKVKKRLTQADLRKLALEGARVKSKEDDIFNMTPGKGLGVPFLKDVDEDEVVGLGEGVADDDGERQGRGVGTVQEESLLVPETGPTQTPLLKIGGRKGFRSNPAIQQLKTPKDTHSGRADGDGHGDSDSGDSGFSQANASGAGAGAGTINATAAAGGGRKAWKLTYSHKLAEKLKQKSKGGRGKQQVSAVATTAAFPATHHASNHQVTNVHADSLSAKVKQSDGKVEIQYQKVRSRGGLGSGGVLDGTSDSDMLLLDDVTADDEELDDEQLQQMFEDQ